MLRRTPPKKRLFKRLWSLREFAIGLAFKDQTLILGLFQKLVENGFLHAYFDLAPVFEWDEFPFLVSSDSR